MTTLLTQGWKPPTEEELNQRKNADQALDVCRLILSKILEAYAEGELTFETSVKQAAQAIKAEHIPKDFQRQKMLGAFTAHICDITPKPRSRRSSRKYPDWVKNAAIGLIEIVHEKEGLKKERISSTGMTAYERTSEIMNMRGIEVSAYEVERFYMNKDKTRAN